MAIAVIILGAGKGTRMQSDLPKVLHEIAQAPMLLHTMQTAAQLESEKTVVVVGHGGDAVADCARSYDENAIIVRQEQQHGTGHAVAQAQSALQGFDGDVLVLYGDTPFIPLKRLQEMQTTLKNGASVCVLGFHSPMPNDYGKLIVKHDGLQAIVEQKDATESQRAITLCNSGVIGASNALLFALLDELDSNNASGEIYLTDIVAKARARDLKCAVIECDESQAMGVNSRDDLRMAQAQFQTNARTQALDNGVELWAPETVFFAYDTQIGRDVVIEPHVIFGPQVTVETGACIRGFSHISGAHIGQGAIVGPYARLRPRVELGNGAHVGNFVEIKATKVGDGAKVNHLSYVGDATIGENANIGAGTITCNYDGVFKHHTDIGAGAFIGSNSSLVAPVRIGKDAMTGSGSVITNDVPDCDLALGRARQENKSGMAAKLMAVLRAKKHKG